MPSLGYVQDTLDLTSEDCLDAIASLVVVETSPDEYDREARYAEAYERAVCTWEFEHGQ